MFELTQTADLCHWRGGTDDPTWRSLVHDVQSLAAMELSSDKRRVIETQSSKPATEDTQAPMLGVLHFVDLSPDKKQLAFIEGLYEEIRSGLTFLSNTALVHGAGHGTRYRLEGSVRGSNEHLRVTVKLIQSSDGKQLWSESFDGPEKDEFSLQELIASTIDAQLRSHIFKAEVTRLQNVPEDRYTATDFYLKSIALVADLDTQSIKLALACAEKALELEPRLASAHALAARHCATLNMESGDWDPDQVARRAVDHAAQAMRSAEQDPYTHQFLSMAMITLGGDLTPLEAMAERLLAKMPNNPTPYITLGSINAFQGQKTAGCRKCIETAIRLNPNWEGDIYVLVALMVSHFELGEFKEAADCANEISFRREHFALAHAVAAGSYAHLGEMDAAQAAFAQIKPEMRIKKILIWFRDSKTRDLLRSGLELAEADH